MALPPQIRVLFFDVFGTCVQQRKPVADELFRAAQEALDSDSFSINDEIRANTEKMSYEQWDELGAEWNKENEKFVRQYIAEHGTVEWRAVDKDRIALLPRLLAKRRLILLDDSSKAQVRQGSLWNEPQLEYLGRIWHRLTPWPDTCRGLDLLNKKFTTVTLSNTYTELMEGLVAHSNIPFKHILTSETFQSYKPNAEVYLGAAKKLGVRFQECALVAAHLSDLRGAKACGFYAINVVRPLEEKAPELRKDNIPDMVIEENENGFIALAERLGIDL